MLLSFVNEVVGWLIEHSIFQLAAGQAFYQACAWQQERCCRYVAVDKGTGKELTGIVSMFEIFRYIVEDGENMAWAGELSEELRHCLALDVRGRDNPLEY